METIGTAGLAPASRRMPELVLLPGMDGTASLFPAFIAALGDRIPTRALAYPADATDYRELAAWVRQRLPRGEFVLLGESFSGPIAASLATERPDGLVGLVLCSTFLRNPRPRARYLAPLAGMVHVSRGAARLVAPALLGRRHDAALMRQFVDAVGSMQSATLRGRLRSVLSADGSMDLSGIDVPVLCLRATHDVLVPRSAAEWIRHAVPSARIVDVDGPHALLQVAPVDCSRLVADFVASVSADR